MKNIKANAIKGFSVLLFAFIMYFGMGISAQAMGNVGYIAEPPSDSEVQDVKDVFNLVGTSKVDSQYPNVAVVTLDTSNQFGALWSKEQLDLTKSFNAEMYLYLGHASDKKGTLADGMTFTMHNNSTALTGMVGGRGEGLGVYRGRKSTGGYSTQVEGTYLKNSLVIEFDTYRNLINNGSYVDDPSYSAHCSLVNPKANTIYQSDHKNTFSFSPTQKWVKFEVEWKPNGSNGGLLTYSFNGTTKQYNISNVNTVFGGTKVYWGFTGATGLYSSIQAVAITSLPSTAETYCTVAYDKNANEATGTMDSQKALKGSEITVSENQFVRPGYAFKGWSTSPGGGVEYKYPEKITLTQDMTLYAVWGTPELYYDFTTDKNTAEVGDSIGYTLILGNANTAYSTPWYNATATITFNDYVSYIDGSTIVKLNGNTIQAATYNAQSNSLIINLGTMNPGDEYVITFTGSALATGEGSNVSLDFNAEGQVTLSGSRSVVSSDNKVSIGGSSSISGSSRSAASSDNQISIGGSSDTVSIIPAE